MAEIQGRVAQGNGYGDLWEQANAVTVERKALEQSMQRTLGRGLNQSVVTRLKGATDALLRGDVKKWDQLFDDLPVDQRQAAAAQALDTVLFTSGKGTKMSESFVANFQKIKRDAQLRDRVFDNLPMDSRKTFMDIGDAATGFFRAMERNRGNPSGTANARAVQKAIEDGTIANRVLGGLRTGSEKVPILGDLFKRAPDRSVTEIKRARLKAAADMLTDPDLHRAIREYAAGRVDEANKLLRGSIHYDGFARTLNEAERTRLQQFGIVALIGDEE